MEKAYRVCKHGANRSKEIREVQNKEQTAQTRLEKLAKKSKPLEKDKSFSEKGASHSKETKEF